MRETPDQAVVDRRLLEPTPYPAWSEIVKRIKVDRRPAPGTSRAPGREWSELVADMIVGRH